MQAENCLKSIFGRAARLGICMTAVYPTLHLKTRSGNAFWSDMQQGPLLHGMDSEHIAFCIYA